MLKKSVVEWLSKILGKEGVLLAPEALKSYSYDGTTNCRNSVTPYQLFQKPAGMSLD